MNHAVFAQDNRLDIGRVADADDDDVAGFRHRFGRVSRRCAALDEGRHAAGGAIPNGDVKAGLHQVVDHAASHDAQADESNFLAHVCPRLLGSAYASYGSVNVGEGTDWETFLSQR